MISLLVLNVFEFMILVLLGVIVKSNVSWGEPYSSSSSSSSLSSSYSCSGCYSLFFDFFLSFQFNGRTSAEFMVMLAYFLKSNSSSREKLLSIFHFSFNSNGPYISMERIKGNIKRIKSRVINMLLINYQCLERQFKYKYLNLIVITNCLY